MSYAVPRVFSGENYHSAYCHIAFGVLKATMIGGYTVREIRHAIREWNVPADADAKVRRGRTILLMGDSSIVKAGDYLEFHKRR